MASRKPILLDGAMGTQLQAKVGDIGKYPEMLNQTHAKEIREIHQAYAAAGADIITSHTFTLSPSRAQKAEYKFQDILRRALINSVESGLPVALDVGPLGKLLEPYGDLKTDEAHAEFAAMISLGGQLADYILIETLVDLREAEVAIDAAMNATDKPVFITMTFKPDGTTFMGATAEDFAARADALGVNALGFNCTVNPLEGHTIFEKLRSATDLPIIVQPNQLDDPNEFADAMMWYAERGAAYLGGCCGTTPEHTKALRALIDN
jgi:5-methyltetrahydrofolate--homocysteine methyltransferase